MSELYTGCFRLADAIGYSVAAGLFVFGVVYLLLSSLAKAFDAS